MTYRFVSPIEANRDAVAKKLAKKGAIISKRQETMTITDRELIKDKDDPAKIIEVKEGQTKDVEMFIVESDVMP